VASVEQLAAHIRRGLALVATARTALAHVHGLVGEVTASWAQTVESTNDRDAAQLPVLAGTVAAGIGECHAATTQAEQLLTAYLGTLGVDEPAGVPKGSPATTSTPAPEPMPSPRADRIERARQRVGESRMSGSQARGEWVRSDGWSVRLTSGRDDEHHRAALRFIRDNNLPRPASQLARHVEVKVAVSMWERGSRDETVVMDRQVCGTREFDRDDPFTCDKYLARFLPPGARLRVVQPDGTVSEYIGTETEQ
jgi:hypothetical protein